jgi:MoaA/NifB/PqqE/SkfB family radical SAM enzyme
MHFDPRGQVFACCANKTFVLGRWGEQGLAEIWESASTRRLRDALSAGDLSLGCGDCAGHIDRGHPEVAWARIYDRLEPADRPVRLELELTDTCNLQCIQCNGDLSSAIRARREGRPPLATVYDDSFFDELAGLLPRVREITFLGGEPFLGRETLRVFDLLTDRGLQPWCHVTTNGTVWNDRVARILDAVPVNVSVSIDAIDPAAFRSIRVGAELAPVLTNLDRFIRSAARSGTRVGINFCLMHPNVGEFVPLLRFADEKGLAVFVNRVVQPASVSLLGLALADLEAAVARLTDDPDADDLGLNRAVYDAVVEELRDLVTTLRGRRAAEGDPRELAERLARDFADGRGVHRLVVDDHDIVRSVSPDPERVLGAPLPTVGCFHLRDLMTAMVAHFGPAGDTTSTVPSAGVQQHEITFGSPGAGGVAVRVFRSSARSGESVCFVTARELDAEATG